ncbi:fimbrial protein [Pseudomonas sp. GT1P32]
MRTLLLVSAFFSGNLLAATTTTCTFNDVTIPTPALTLAARDATLPTVISNSWHEVGGGLGSCKNVPSTSDFFSYANNVVSRTAQTLVFEGVSYTIHSSGVKGVGIIMAAADGNRPYEPFLLSAEIRMWASSTGVVAASALSKYRVRFVATELLQPGTINIPSIRVMRHGIYMKVDDEYYGFGFVTTQGTTLNVKYPVCKLSVPGVIKLPTVDIGSLGGAQTTAGETPFSIDLDCGAGASNVNVKYTLSDISSPTNTSSTLGLANVPDSASGFALQVLENGLPVSFGPDSSAIGTTNQRDFGKLTSAGGHLGKSFTVRYLRTTVPVVAGKVNAGMTITMSYQ